jgi:hypothetical protein
MDLNVLFTQGSTVLLLPIIVQAMKRSEWPMFRWISDETELLNKWLTRVGGALVAVGIHMQGHFSAGHLQIDVTGLSWDAIQAVAAQLGGQEFVYTSIQTLEAVRALPGHLEDLKKLMAAGTQPQNPPST